MNLLIIIKLIMINMVIIMIVMSMMLTCSTRPVGPSSHPATAIPPLLYSSTSGFDAHCEDHEDHEDEYDDHED